MKGSDHWLRSIQLFEDPVGKMSASGVYSNGNNNIMEGAYILSLGNNNESFTNLNIRYYEIPNPIIKSYEYYWQTKLKYGKTREDDYDLGIKSLQIKKIYITPDETTKIIAEKNYSMSNQALRPDELNAGDIYVLSINPEGKLEWVRKIPKEQGSSNLEGKRFSIKTCLNGDDLFIFYFDNIINIGLKETQSPEPYRNGKESVLTAVVLSDSGDKKQYIAGDISPSGFSIRNFRDGGNNNLIRSEGRRKKKVLYFLKIKFPTD